MYSMSKFIFGEQIVNSVSKASEWLARGAVLAIVALTCLNVVLRLFGLPIQGTFEMVMLLGAMAVSFALPSCTLQKGHTSVELVVDRLPERIRAIIDSFTGTLSICLFSLVCWQFGVYATKIWKADEITNTARLPLFPFLYIAFISFLVLCLVLAIQLVKSLKRSVKK